MKLRYVATGLLTGVAAVAISAAPIASAAANPSSTTESSRTTSIDKQGHNSIVVHPPVVSTPKSYGPFTSPLPIAMFD